MQHNELMGAIAALSMLASGAAMAAPQDGFRGQALLASPATSGKSATVNGVSWTCEGSTCEGRAERFSSLESHMKECRKVAQALGPLTGYRSQGLVMSKGSLGVCNRAAQAVGTQAAN